jgi:hypothetical protein
MARQPRVCPESTRKGPFQTGPGEHTETPDATPRKVYRIRQTGTRVNGYALSATFALDTVHVPERWMHRFWCIQRGHRAARPPLPDRTWPVGPHSALTGRGLSRRPRSQHVARLRAGLLAPCPDGARPARRRSVRVAQVVWSFGLLRADEHARLRSCLSQFHPCRALTGSTQADVLS